MEREENNFSGFITVHPHVLHVHIDTSNYWREMRVFSTMTAHDTPTSTVNLGQTYLVTIISGKREGFARQRTGGFIPLVIPGRVVQARVHVVMRAGTRSCFECTDEVSGVGTEFVQL